MRRVPGCAPGENRHRGTRGHRRPSVLVRLLSRGLDPRNPRKEGRGDTVPIRLLIRTALGAECFTTGSVVLDAPARPTASASSPAVDFLPGGKKSGSTSRRPSGLDPRTQMGNPYPSSNVERAPGLRTAYPSKYLATIRS